jgi:hypothetical protein
MRSKLGMENYIMRRKILVSTLLLLFAALTPALAAHALDGTWEFAVTLSAGEGTATLELKVDGNAVTGTYTGQVGTAPVTGTVNGDAVELSFDSQAGKVTYSGKLADGTITGTAVYGELGDGTFVAKKKATEA